MINDDLIKLVREGVYDQRELLERMRKIGHDLTQSTISRRLRSIGVIKISGKYQIEGKGLSFAPCKFNFVAPNLIIINTGAGSASAIAAKIDHFIIKKYPEFIATIAGDDTIFLAVEINNKTADELIIILEKELN